MLNYFLLSFILTTYICFIEKYTLLFSRIVDIVQLHLLWLLINLVPFRELNWSFHFYDLLTSNVIFLNIKSHTIFKFSSSVNGRNSGGGDDVNIVRYADSRWGVTEVVGKSVYVPTTGSLMSVYSVTSRVADRAGRRTEGIRSG